MKVGANTPGIEVDAASTVRNNVTRLGLLLAAMAPMFQMVVRCASRLVVAIISMRPLRCSTAMASINAGVAYLAISSFNGSDLKAPAPKSTFTPSIFSRS